MMAMETNTIAALLPGLAPVPFHAPWRRSAVDAPTWTVIGQALGAGEGDLVGLLGGVGAGPMAGRRPGGGGAAGVRGSLRVFARRRGGKLSLHRPAPSARHPARTRRLRSLWSRPGRRPGPPRLARSWPMGAWRAARGADAGAPERSGG